MELCGWGRYLARCTPSARRCRAPHAGPRERRLHPVLGLQPVGRPAGPRHGTQAALARARREADRGRSRAARGSPTRPTTGCGCAPGPTARSRWRSPHVMIERGWYDRDFVRDWTNGPCWCGDTGRLLREGPVAAGAGYVAWDEAPRAARLRPGGPLARRAAARSSAGTRSDVERRSPAGPCSSSSPSCAALAPAAAEAITGCRAEIERAARMLWESRPVAFYAWSGLEQHSNDPDHPRDQRALRPDRQLRRARRQRAVHRAVPTNPSTARSCSTRRSARRRSASTSGRSARPGSSSSPARTSTPRRSRGSPTGSRRW